MTDHDKNNQSMAEQLEKVEALEAELARHKRFQEFANRLGMKVAKAVAETLPKELEQFRPSVASVLGPVIGATLVQLSYDEKISDLLAIAERGMRGG